MSLPLTRRITRAALLVAAGTAAGVGAAGSALAAPGLPATPNLSGVTTPEVADARATVHGATKTLTGTVGTTGGQKAEKAAPVAGETGGRVLHQATPLAQKTAGDVAGTAGDTVGDTTGPVTGGAHLPTGQVPTDRLPTNPLPTRQLPLG